MNVFHTAPMEILHLRVLHNLHGYYACSGNDIPSCYMLFPHCLEVSFAQICQCSLRTLQQFNASLLQAVLRQCKFHGQKEGQSIRTQQEAIVPHSTVPECCNVARSSYCTLFFAVES